MRALFLVGLALADCAGDVCQAEDQEVSLLQLRANSTAESGTETAEASDTEEGASEGHGPKSGCGRRRRSAACACRRRSPKDHAHAFDNKKGIVCSGNTGNERDRMVCKPGKQWNGKHCAKATSKRPKPKSHHRRLFGKAIKPRRFRFKRR